MLGLPEAPALRAEPPDIQHRVAPGRELPVEHGSKAARVDHVVAGAKIAMDESHGLYGRGVEFRPAKSPFDRRPQLAERVERRAKRSTSARAGFSGGLPRKSSFFSGGRTAVDLGEFAPEPPCQLPGHRRAKGLWRCEGRVRRPSTSPMTANGAPRTSLSSQKPTGVGVSTPAACATSRILNSSRRVRLDAIVASASLRTTNSAIFPGSGKLQRARQFSWNRPTAHRFEGVHDQIRLAQPFRKLCPQPCPDSVVQHGASLRAFIG